jgi:hypothetical protein
VRLDALRRQALVNGAISGVVTLVVGIVIVAGVSSGDLEIPRPSSSPSPTPTPPPCDPSWEIVPSADPNDVPNTLNAVVALAGSEAWAVGGSGDPASPVGVLIERWDGTEWIAEEGPNPGSQTNELLAVDASGPNDIWAVGRTASGFGDRPLALHYDGTEWLEVGLPEEVTGVLLGVAAVAANDVWVVGFTGDPDASLEHAIILHWDGLLWAVVDGGRAVGSGTSALRDVKATAPNDVWAVGYLHNRPLIVRWDGQAWARSDTEVKGVANEVEPLTPTEGWVVGEPIQRFDGTTWSQDTTVRADGELLSAATVGPSDVWAVGLRPVEEGVTRSLVMRFDGQRWTQVEGRGATGSDALTGVDALPDGTVLGVGYKDVESGRRTLAIQGTTCFAVA